MDREPLGRFRAGAVLGGVVLAMSLMSVAPAGVGRADPPAVAKACAIQQQALDGVNAQIAQHNAQPHEFIVPQQQAAADAYNAEAARLNARGVEAQNNLKSCAVAMSRLADGETLPTPTQSVINKIDDAKRGLPAGYVPPAAPPRSPSGGVVVVQELRPLIEELRQQDDRPDDLTLQHKPKPNVGDPDPARSGAAIPAMASDPSRPMVVVDHIVPPAQLVCLPGFVKLPAEYMYIVANAPVNLQWMSAYGSAAKGSASVAFIGDADPQWLQVQQGFEESTRRKLQDIVDQLLATLPPG